MQIPSEIDALIKRLNEELDRVELETTEGLKIARAILEGFSSNTILIQFLAYLSSVTLLVDTDRARIQAIAQNFSEISEATPEEIQETGEILATELGRILEAKIAVIKIRNRLKNLL